VAQKSVDEKTNEIPELRALPAPMEIEGQILTADALHTQTDTARFIIEDKKADSVFTVKINQPTLLEDIASLSREAFPPLGRTLRPSIRATAASNVARLPSARN